MAHIHITLVGGQPIPVYIGIVYAKPDKIIYVCSQQTHTEVIRLQQEVDIDSEIIYLDPVDLVDIESKIEQLSLQFESHTISINISSGTKPWSYYFAKTFGNKANVSIMYVDQNNIVRNFNDYTIDDVSLNLDIRFRLYGNQLTNFSLLSDYCDADYAAIEKIRKVRQFNYDAFHKLTNLFSRHTHTNYFNIPNGSTLEWNKSDSEIIFKMYNNEGRFKRETIDSPKAIDLVSNTGWFEVEVAQLISKWDKVKELRLNCVFPTKSNSPKNEIDIIIDTYTKLLFVECKTQIKNETDIDKFAAAVKVYGGMGSKALFITDVPLKEKALEKCRDNKILHFSLKGGDGKDNSADSLFQLLDNNLYNINPI